MKAGHSGPSFKADLLKILDSYTKRPSVFSKIKTFPTRFSKAFVTKNINQLNGLVSDLFNNNMLYLQSNSKFEIEGSS